MALVLEALCGPPLGHIGSVHMKFLLYKTALPLALASAKQVSDIHLLYLCILPVLSLLHMALRSCWGQMQHICLRLSLQLFKSMTFELLSFCPSPFASEEQRRLYSLCPVCTLRTYKGMHLCDKFFVCFANPAKAFSTQRLSH